MVGGQASIGQNNHRTLAIIDAMNNQGVAGMPQLWPTDREKVRALRNMSGRVLKLTIQQVRHMGCRLCKAVGRP